MLKETHHPQGFCLPPLLYGEKQARMEEGFYGMTDQFSHLTPECDYDSKAKKGFIFKGNVLNINGLVINQNYYSHMLAVAPVRENNLLIPLAGTHYGLFRGQKMLACQNQGFFIPANDRFQFETDLDGIAGSLIITYDQQRLNQAMQVMTPGEHCLPLADQVRPLPLAKQGVNFRKLFFNLFTQVDAFGGNTGLLVHSGFDEQFYRLLAMCLAPEVFLQANTTQQSTGSDQHKLLMARFEQYVEDNMEKTISLSELEVVLGVSARTLQYACLRSHGCSPRTYIRNKKLDHAYQHLSGVNAPVKLASLAFALGFSSQSQFTHYFRERFGILPSQIKGPSV